MNCKKNCTKCAFGIYQGTGIMFNKSNVEKGRLFYCKLLRRVVKEDGESNKTTGKKI